ncbi:MAG: hypothetical protein LBC41_02605 [Clostridiales bacterium]|nr:hypothetical protein [Clostridiales bacterium]
MFANFPGFLRFLVRRERVTSVIWLAAMSISAVVIASLFPGILPTEEAMQGMALTLNSPAMVAMMGPVYGLDALNPAIVMAEECLIWFGIASIIMNVFFINRHTRVDEELGRDEMLAALPTGRMTGATAAITGALALNLAISLLTFLLLSIFGIEGVTLSGSFVYAFSIGMTGFVFAAATLLFAQLFSTARGVTGAAFAFMGLSYIIRAYGDMSNSSVSLISPMGLGLKVEAFYSDRVWPIIILFIEGLVISAIALAICSVRDVGAGIIPAGKGKSHASRFLKSPLGLAWRLTRGGTIGWAIGMVAIGLSYGSVIGELETFVQGNDTIRMMLEGRGGASSLAEGYLAMLAAIMSLIAAIPLVLTVNRLHGEEKRGRMEQISALSIPRDRLLVAFTILAVIQAFAMPVLYVLGLYAAVGNTGILPFGMIMQASLAYIPALLLMVGLAVVLSGYAPKFISLIWAVFAFSFFTFYFGRLTELPEWVSHISPFDNIPQIPVEEFSAVPLVILCVIAAATFVAGFAGYKKRDLL